MLTFVTLAALSIGLIVFLIVLNLPSVSGKAAPAPEKPDRLNAGKVLRMKDIERPRLCPVCGTILNKDEYLFASIFPENGDGKRRQAHIYGCAHCYRTEGVNLNRVDPQGFETVKEKYVASRT